MMKSRHNGSGDRGCKSAANVSYYLVDRNIESGEADVTALIIDGVQVTYGELYRRSSNVAAGLEEFGVRREDRVMLVLPDDANFVYCFLAALRIGAIPVPVNPHAAVRDVLDTADRSGVRAAITHRCELATHFETMPRPPIVLGVGWEPSASRSIDELVSVDRERPAEPGRGLHARRAE